MVVVVVVVAVGVVVGVVVGVAMSDPAGAWATIRLPRDLYDTFVMVMENILIATGDADIASELTETQKKLAIERIIQLFAGVSASDIQRWIESGDRRK